MDFDWTWESFLGVEFLAEQFRQHFVDANVSQEQIVVFEQLALVFELLEITLQTIESDHLGDARDFEFLNLTAEVTLGVLDDHTDSAVVICCHKWERNSHLQGSGSWIGRNLSQGEVDMNKRIFVLEQVL